MELKKFVAQLERKFPWPEMETTVSPDVFKDEYARTAEFWEDIDRIFSPNRQDDAFRCIQMLDFIGRCVNQRYGEVSLSHCKNLQFARLMLKYMRESVLWKDRWTVLQALTLLDIIFEVKNGIMPEDERNELLNLCSQVQYNLYPERLIVGNRSLTLAYLNSGYDYLWEKDGTFARYLRMNGLLS